MTNTMLSTSVVQYKILTMTCWTWVVSDGGINFLVSLGSECFIFAPQVRDLYFNSDFVGFGLSGC